MLQKIQELGLEASILETDCKLIVNDIRHHAGLESVDFIVEDVVSSILINRQANKVAHGLANFALSSNVEDVLGEPSSQVFSGLSL